LQILQDRNSEELPRILGIGDGETSQRVAEICREENLSLSLIADPDRGIARQYGVNTWPTLVSINDLGQIDWVHAGLTHKGPESRTF